MCFFLFFYGPDIYTFGTLFFLFFVFISPSRRKTCPARDWSSRLGLVERIRLRALSSPCVYRRGTRCCSPDGAAARWAVWWHLRYKRINGTGYKIECAVKTTKIMPQATHTDETYRHGLMFCCCFGWIGPKVTTVSSAISSCMGWAYTSP